MVVESNEVAEKFCQNWNSQIASIRAIFISTYHTKQLNPWPTPPASHVVIYSQLSTCPGEVEPFKHYWQASETIHSKNNPISF